MSHRFATTLLLSVSGGEEREMPAVVEYDRTPGSPATYDDPGSAPVVEVVSVSVVVGQETVAVPWLATLLATDADLLADLLQHWADEDEAARDRRDEDRAERMREEREIA